MAGFKLKKDHQCRYPEYNCIPVLLVAIENFIANLTCIHLLLCLVTYTKVVDMLPRFTMTDRAQVMFGLMIVIQMFSKLHSIIISAKAFHAHQLLRVFVTVIVQFFLVGAFLNNIEFNT